ncbi:MAG TPA: transporter substrate-binding domain-containing protein [Dongiaceae bacterium]
MRFLFRKVLIFCCLAIWPAIAEAACEKTVGWAWNEYKPYSYRSANGEVVGLDADLTRAILEQVGCQYAVQEIPAKRALKMLETGEIDLVAAASVTPEREAYGYFSAPYRSERIVMFIRRDDTTAAAIKGLHDALSAHLRVAAGNGGSYGKEYDTLRGELKAADLLTLNASLEQRLQLLAGHRVDIVVEDEVAGASTARDLGLAANLQVVGAPLSDQPVRLLLSRKSVSPALVSSIDQAIKTLQATPTYAAILARHSTLNQ